MDNQLLIFSPFFGCGYWICQICHEFERFSTYLPDIKVAVFYGGVNIKIHKDLLKNVCPHIAVGTPGRILALARDKDLALRNVRHFILDECDKMLESLGMLLFFVNILLEVLDFPCFRHFKWFLFVSFFVVFLCLIILQIWGKMCRKYSRWLLMISRLWCFQQHWARKFALSARSLCKM